MDNCLSRLLAYQAEGEEFRYVDAREKYFQSDEFIGKLTLDDSSDKNS